MQHYRTVAVLAVSSLIAATAWSTTIEARNLCDDNCTMKDVVLNFPEHVDGVLGVRFNFSIRATMLRNMSFLWRHQITVLTGPSPADIEIWNNTGVPCGYTFAGDPVWMQVHMNFPDCHAASGNIEIFGGVIFHGVILPGVPVETNVHLWDDQGNEALQMRVRLSHPILAERTSEVLPTPTIQQLQPRQPVQASGALVGRHTSMHFPRTEITAHDCCDQACRLKNVSMNFPNHLDGFEMSFNVTGQFEQETSDIRYSIHGVLEVLNIFPAFTVLVANGSLCGYTTIGDHTEFTLGLDPGMCPFAAGDYTLAGWTKFTLPFDWLGNVTLRVEAVEENSRQRVACADVNLHVGFSSNNNAALPSLVSMDPKILV